MAYGNFNYETRFTAVNTMTPVVNEATNSMEMLRGSVNRAGDSARNASEGFRGLNASISTGLMSNLSKTHQSVSNVNSQLMSLRGALFGVQMGLFYVSMLASNMMMLESAANNVEGAQERLNKVIKEGGRGTLEYRNAVRQLENAQINLQRTQTMTSIMTVAMGFQVVSMGVSFAQAVPGITKLINTLKNYNVVAAVTKALSGQWVTLAAGLAIGAGATVAVNALMNQPASSKSGNINVEVVTNSPYDSFMRQNRTNAVTSGVG